MKTRIGGLLAVLALGLALGACDKKEDTSASAMDRAKESVGDAFDSRENEKLKDAGEDAEEALDNAAEGMKEKMGVDGN